MSGRNVKKRNWVFLVYPDSAPSDWVSVLQSTGLSCAISPLHDRDVNPTGEPKKPHYHVIACYSGPTSYNVVKSLTDGLNAPIPQPLEQVRGYYRYLTHKDNPEKAQYCESDIRCLNGFDLADFCELSKVRFLLIRKNYRFLSVIWIFWNIRILWIICKIMTFLLFMILQVAIHIFLKSIFLVGGIN